MSLTCLVKGHHFPEVPAYVVTASEIEHRELPLYKRVDRETVQDGTWTQDVIVEEVTPTFKCVRCPKTTTGEVFPRARPA